MTQAAYQKKKLKTQKYMANLHAKAVYGLNVDDMVKQIKKDETLLKEKDNVLKEKDNVLKEKDNVLKEKDNVLKEKDNVLKEKDNVLKENETLLKEKDIVLKEKEDKIRHLVLKLYTENGKSIESIAEFMDMSLVEVETIIDDNIEKKDKK